MLRKSGAVLTAFLLAMGSSTAFAADVSTATAPSPLAPGNAAGVRAAQDWYTDNSDVIFIGLGVVAVAAVVIIANDHHHHHGASGSTGTK